MPYAVSIWLGNSWMWFVSHAFFENLEHMNNFLNISGTWIDIPSHPDVQLKYQRTVDFCWVYDMISTNIWSICGWLVGQIVRYVRFCFLKLWKCWAWPAQQAIGVINLYKISLKQLITFVEEVVLRVVELCFRLGFWNTCWVTVCMRMSIYHCSQCH